MKWIGVVDTMFARVNMGEIALQAAEDPMAHHKNKFGEDYRPSHSTPY